MTEWAAFGSRATTLEEILKCLWTEMGESRHLQGQEASGDDRWDEKLHGDWMYELKDGSRKVSGNWQGNFTMKK